jgi:hypothetical protein
LVTTVLADAGRTKRSVEPALVRLWGWAASGAGALRAGPVMWVVSGEWRRRPGRPFRGRNGSGAPADPTVADGVAAPADPAVAVDGDADATAFPLATAAPMPRATANPPTRPTYAEFVIIASPCDRDLAHHCSGICRRTDSWRANFSSDGCLSKQHLLKIGRDSACSTL